MAGHLIQMRTREPPESCSAARSCCCRRPQVRFRRTNSVRLQRTAPDTAASSRPSGGATCVEFDQGIESWMRLLCLQFSSGVSCAC